MAVCKRLGRVGLRGLGYVPVALLRSRWGSLVVGSQRGGRLGVVVGNDSLGLSFGVGQGNDRADVRPGNGESLGARVGGASDGGTRGVARRHDVSSLQ